MASIVPFTTIPQLFNNLSAHFSGKNKSVFGFKPAPNVPFTSLNWDIFTEDVNQLASYLIEEGIEKGDRVAILSENRYEWSVVDMALNRVGAVNVALYSTLPADQCEYILQDSGSKIFFVSTGIQLKKAIDVFDNCPDLKKVVAFETPKNKAHLDNDYLVLFEDARELGKSKYSSHYAEIEKRIAAVTEDDLATLIYTSGTTGKPKGAMLTHKNICSNSHAALDRIPVRSTDRTLSFLPLCHAFERTGGYYAVLAAGAEIYYAESVDTVAKNLPEVNPTIVVSVPRLFEKVHATVLKSASEGSEVKKKIFYWALEVGEAYWRGKRGFTSIQKNLADKLVFQKLKDRTGGKIRFFVSGGAALNADVAKFFFSAGLPIVEGYGLTETSPVISANPVGEERLGTVGHVFPDVTVGIQRLQDGKIIAQVTGEDYPTTLTSGDGEILCKGPNIMAGYWGKPEATAEVIDKDGWFHTGDVGRFENGYLRITDRIKHMIVNAGGKNIYPGPIEDSLKTSKWIDQVVLLGEKKNFITALIVPDYEQLKTYASQNGITFNTYDDLIENEAIASIYEKEVKTFSKQMASHEKIRKFKLLATEFTVETGELTPTMKVKRKVIEQKYHNLIDEMYNDDND
ncbi:long-chain fatty acid--CoA ligase [bacterium]|nr:MAG: long-chain fatty acid--CoA ligase [bacterium]